MISQKLKVTLKMHDEPAYRVAQKAGLSPSTLSKLICGIEKTKPNDHRVIAVGRVLGLLPEECLEEIIKEQRS